MKTRLAVVTTCNERVLIGQDSNKHMNEYADLEAEILLRLEADEARNNHLQKQVSNMRRMWSMDGNVSNIFFEAQKNVYLFAICIPHTSRRQPSDQYDRRASARSLIGRRAYRLILLYPLCVNLTESLPFVLAICSFSRRLLTNRTVFFVEFYR